MQSVDNAVNSARSTYRLAKHVIWLFGAVVFVATVLIIAIPELDEAVSSNDLLKKIRVGLWFLAAVVGPIALFSLRYNLESKIAKRNSDKLNTRLDELIDSRGSSIELINPHEIDDFLSVFAGAKRIRAYNPPLTLLALQEGHREAIYNILRSNLQEYKIIAGNASMQFLSDFYSELKKEKGSMLGTVKGPMPGFKRAVDKIKVIHFDHELDLHTEIRTFGTLDKDLRGLSFFLIETLQGRDIVLLYLFGDPFATEFKVTQHAIKIVSRPRSKGDDLFDKLSNTYNQKWVKLESSNEEALRPLPLSKFYEQKLENRLH